MRLSLFSVTGSAYRECMENGTWAFRSNYSNCEPILEEKVGYALCFFNHELLTYGHPH